MRYSILSALLAGTAIVAAPSLAQAEEFSLHLEPGLVAPLSAPQSTLYNPGMVLGAKGMFVINQNLSLGPSVSSLYLPRAIDNGENAGVLWQWGGSIRLQGNRSSVSTPWSPWIDLDVMAAHTGDLWRPAFDVGVGEEMTFDQAHTFWAGPFVRFTHAFETSDWQNGFALDRRDVNIIQGGVSFSFDFPTLVRQQTVVYDRVATETLPCVGSNSCPAAPVAVQDEGFVLNEKIYFDHDSATLRWESRDRLDVVAKKLNDRPDSKVIIEGHASSDGQAKYNLALSARRAAAVRQYLADHGVETSRLIGIPFGVGSPAAPNTTQEGRERNRRVEFDVSFTSQDQK
jgi:outer membrane protein OmpA-like peptidoglycan-associated protein